MQLSLIQSEVFPKEALNKKISGYSSALKKMGEAGPIESLALYSIKKHFDARLIARDFFTELSLSSMGTLLPNKCALDCSLLLKRQQCNTKLMLN